MLLDICWLPLMLLLMWLNDLFSAHATPTLGGLRVIWILWATSIAALVMLIERYAPSMLLLMWLLNDV